MNKQAIKNKLIEFQQKILSLTQIISDKERECADHELQNNLDLIAIIDSFETIFNRLSKKDNATEVLNKSSRQAIKSCQAIYRKTIQILDKKGVIKICFADNMAQPGLCKIIETQMDLTKKEGTIIKIIKNGYQQGDQIIRLAEVMTISHHT